MEILKENMLDFSGSSLSSISPKCDQPPRCHMQRKKERKKESNNQGASNNEKPWSDSKGHSNRYNERVGFEIFCTRAALQSSGLYNRVAWKKITPAIKEGNKGLRILQRKTKKDSSKTHRGSFGALITMMTDVLSWNSKEPRKWGVFCSPVWHCCH